MIVVSSVTFNTWKVEKKDGKKVGDQTNETFKKTLKQIIKEELQAVMTESSLGFPDPELEQDLMDGVRTLPYDGYLEEEVHLRNNRSTLP